MSVWKPVPFVPIIGCNNSSDVDSECSTAKDSNGGDNLCHYQGLGCVTAYYFFNYRLCIQRTIDGEAFNVLQHSTTPRWCADNNDGHWKFKFSQLADNDSFAYVGGIWNPIWGWRGGRRGSAMAPLERAMVVSYRLSIVTVALSVTIRPQFAIEYLRRSNQQGVGDFVPKFRGVPLEADPSCWDSKERTSQAN